MSRPPTHIQAISGSTTTVMAIDPAGRLAMTWPPVDGAGAADRVEGQVDVVEEARVDGRRPDRLGVGPSYLLTAG